MSLKRPGRREMIAGLIMAATVGGLAHAAKPHKPDLADALAGSWSGDVISDSQGSGRPGVTLTLTRVGPNTVRIDSDYPRLPVITVPLEKAMSSIVNRTGDTAFAFDGRSGKLDVSFHNQVSWSGRKAGQ